MHLASAWKGSPLLVLRWWPGLNRWLVPRVLPRRVIVMVRLVRGLCGCTLKRGLLLPRLYPRVCLAALGLLLPRLCPKVRLAALTLIRTLTRNWSHHLALGLSSRAKGA